MHPEHFSLFKLTTRTTSALEAYNGVLGRLIQKRGNFFKFVEVLRDEEYEKSKQFSILIESGGTIGAKRSKTVYINRSNMILEASEMLEQGKLTPLMFLNRLTYKQNKILDDEVLPHEIDFEDDDDQDQDEDLDTDIEEPTNAEKSANEGSLCIICEISQANTAFLPCKHMKSCNECVLKLQAKCIAINNKKFKCPYCRKDVEETLKLFV